MNIFFCFLKEELCKKSLDVFRAEVVAAAIKGSLMRANSTTPQLSAHALKRGIITFFTNKKLFPKGVRPEMPCVDEWALRAGVCLKRLVA